MPQKERLRVFNGELKKTSGGLTKDDLVKNKRGKIVSRKKSGQAVGADNNLGSWLRNKGDKFSGKPKGFKEEEPDDRDDEKMEVVVEKKKKQVVKQKQVVPKKKVPKKQVPKKQKQVVPKKKLVPKKVAKVKSAKVEPMRPGEVKDLSKISVGNITVEKTDYELDWNYYVNKKKMSAKEVLKKLGKPSAAVFAKLQSKKLKDFLA